MKTKILTLLCIASFSYSSWAQESDSLKNTYSEVGLNLGFTTGVGMSYRHWTGRNGIQFTFIPIVADGSTFVSIGITYLRNYYTSKYTRVFGYVGNHIYITDGDLGYNLGIGPGFSFGNRVQFNIQAGYAIYGLVGNFNLLPTGEMGLYYNF